jgi:hypothetical protein
MKTVLTLIGGLVLSIYVMAWLGLVDLYICVGKPDTCTRQAPQSKTGGLSA